MKEPNTTDIIPPNGERKVLIHTCCAPCVGGIIERMMASGIDCTIFFYNPNVHPEEEYEKRKNEYISFAKRKAIAFVDTDYDQEKWAERVKGLENEPERGNRCTVCFDMRLERTALHAHENGFKVFTSSLGISRWKNLEQINECGTAAASKYPNLSYWTFNWRKKGGSQFNNEISKKEGFYRQNYCGCVFSKNKNLKSKENCN